MIIMDGEWNHSMGSPMDRTLPSPKTDSDLLIKGNQTIYTIYMT